MFFCLWATPDAVRRLSSSSSGQEWLWGNLYWSSFSRLTSGEEEEAQPNLWWGWRWPGSAGRRKINLPLGERPQNQAQKATFRCQMLVSPVSRPISSSWGKCGFSQGYLVWWYGQTKPQQDLVIEGANIEKGIPDFVHRVWNVRSMNQRNIDIVYHSDKLINKKNRF